jgi:PAS domain S-box-containing protein
VNDTSTRGGGGGKETEEQLRQANRALRLFSHCHAAVALAVDEETLLNVICRIAVDSAGYEISWVGRAEHDRARSVGLAAFAGPGEFLHQVRVSWADDIYGRGVVGTAIRTQRVALARDLQHDPNFLAWPVTITERGLGSAVGVTLFVDGHIFGAWAVFAREPDAFDAAEIGLLEELGTSISHGLTAVRAHRHRDMADRAAERLLDRLRRAQAVAHVGSWELDLASRTVWGSEEAARIYGLTLPESGFLPLADIELAALPEHRPALDKAMSDLVTGKGSYDIEFMIRRKSDGALRHIHSRSELGPNANGRPRTALGTIQDITDRKQLEQQLLQAQKMESVGRLAGGVAHDFNNVLAVIQSYCALLLGEVVRDHPFRSDLEEIQRAALRAADLTRQLLAFSRKQVLKPSVVKLGATVANAERMLRRIIGEDVELVTIAAPDVGKVFVDPGQVEQVFMNLAVNARDAMARGGKLTIETKNVRLTTEYASTHPDVRPGPYVMLAMTDTGIGMDPATKALIFEPFFTTKSERGTGLGLSTVYGIVRQSGGHIWVDSEPGRGTTFKVYFPRVADDAVTRDVSPSPRSPGPRMGTETILVVEDDEQLRALVCTILRRVGHTVLCAAGGTEALRLEQEHRGHVHLLFTDVVMPGITGPELATRLSSVRPDTKVLYTSGYADNAIGHQGVLSPGIAFLPKPFTPDTLLEKVREVLDGR